MSHASGSWQAISGDPRGPTSGNTSSFAGTDTATQGNWPSAYGADGYYIPNASTQAPGYGAVALSGDSLYTWAASTTDPRALQIPGGTARIASTYYAANSFSIDINITDGSAHRVALYLDDWDGNNSRNETIQLVDAASGNVLDSRTATGLTSTPEYLKYNVNGHIKFVVTNNAGSINAVVNGIFFGGAVSSPGSGGGGGSSFVRADASTQGNWQGVYGAGGYYIPNSSTSAPAYGALVISGDALYTWAASTSDPRALEIAGSTSRIASTYYAWTSFSIDVNITDGNTHQVALYLDDWDGNNTRNETIQMVDVVSGNVLDNRTVTGLESTPEYLVYSVTGHVKFVVNNNPGSINAVVNGIFFSN
jgi:hypothetical protein